MRFTQLRVDGAFSVDVDVVTDPRGGFARTWCYDEFLDHGLDPAVAQASISLNTCAATLRGLHFQIGTDAETKLVRATAGAAFDVVADVRPDSPTYLTWDAVMISATNHTAVYIPIGVAHGFLTLEDHTELHYQISVPYSAGASSGIRWDDPTLAITWPTHPLVISDRDASLPFLQAAS
jgi:dTDP-4-dehydrorhamnose 3,5-epimerase